MRYLSILLLLFFPLSTFADYGLSGGKLKNKKDIATKSPGEHYSDGMQAMEDGDWSSARDAFRKITANFAQSPYGPDALFYSAKANFE